MRVLASLTVLLIAQLSTALAADDAIMKQAQATFEPIPLKPPALKDVNSTPAMIELGKALFFDPRLSYSGKISCNSCHQVGLGGADTLPTTIGHKWQNGSREVPAWQDRRNAPTVMNAVFNKSQFWDGRASELNERAGGLTRNPIEMGMSADHVLDMLKRIPGYAKPFRDAFPGDANPITIANVSSAIAAFEATLITPNAPFDKYLRGDVGALNVEQINGLKLFMEKGCSSCHAGINVGGQTYAPLGVVERPGAHILPPTDKGRLIISHTASDEYVFRVPPLRNVELTPPYFHSGSSWDLGEAVTVMGASQLGQKLNEDEVTKITAFLKSLTGEQPQVTYPILPPSVETTPRPAQ